MPTPTSRRREALLRRATPGGAAAPASPPRLTGADVEALGRDRTSETRALVAAKFGRQFDDLARSGQRDLAHAVLELLIRDVAREVRRTLAEAVAPSEMLPAPVAARLAGDEIEIAQPILEKSPVLDDEALLEVVRTHSLQYALAIAGRERLSEAVSAALVDTGDQPTVARLVGNAGAALSRQTLERILADHRADPEIGARLVRRPELPYEVVEALVGVIGERIELDLVRAGRMPADQARALVGAVRDRVAIGFTAREHGDKRLEQQLRAELEAGRLTHDDLLRRLKQGDIAGLEIGLALHARLESARVRRLLYHHDRRHMAALCIEAGLATPHYVALRMALDMAETAAGSAKVPEATKSSGETIRFLQAQYERLRQDTAKLRELLGA